MNTNYVTGGNIEAWCTKCKLELDHTIIAIVDNFPKRVKCNTCQGQHNFRGRPAEKKRSASKSPARKKTKSQKGNYIEYLSRLSGTDPSDALQYSIRGSFKKDDVINHPRFGIGIVSSVIQFKKIEVFFRDGARLLTQNQ